MIGPDERISPYDGLRAVTAMAAYQLKEEKTKGTLEPGKLADLVILEQNPLTVDPLTIKDIAVAGDDQGGKDGLEARRRRRRAMKSLHRVPHVHHPVPDGLREHHAAGRRTS